MSFEVTVKFGDSVAADVRRRIFAKIPNSPPCLLGGYD